MSAGNIEHVRAVFLQARALAVNDRPAFLDKACEGDADFRKEVERLLAADAPETLAAPGARSADAMRSSSVDPTAAPSFPLKSLPPGYRFVRELGRGGQAVVCAAVQQSTGRTVAIKIMRDGPLANTASRARFDREAQVLGALQHPYIVKVLDRGVTDDTSQYIVMDYIKGQTLGEWLRHRAANPTRTEDGGSLRMFMKICSAINAAHLRGIVHRDIKPSNILVDERGEPYVLDFGLARPVFDVHAADAPVTLTGEFLGSLPWASPEQAEGDPDKIDTRTDVYALGVILYQLLTGGQFPYAVAGNMRDVLNNILTAEPTPPSTVMAASQAKQQQKRRLRRPTPSAVNEIIEAIVLKTLAKKRDDRYQSAGELEREIANYLAGLPTIAAGQKVLTRRGRNNILAGAMAAAALVLAIALTWGIASHNGRHSIVSPNKSGMATASLANAATTPEKDVAISREPSRDIINSIGMKLVFIPPGEFDMGSPLAEAGRGPYEDLHHVKITEGFLMAAHHVTRAQFAAFVAAVGYKTDAEKQGSAFVFDAASGKGKFTSGASWKNPGIIQAGDHPVVVVSWNDVIAYCAWLSKKEGRHYRLPTEAEWEYACRAGAQTAYFWADDPDAGTAYANCADLTLKDKFKNFTAFNWRDGFVFTSPVGSFKPNKFGLYDMIGNAWQWCSDGWGPYDGDAVDPKGTGDTTFRVIRGGAWTEAPQRCRCAFRSHAPPDDRNDMTGFRVCLDDVTAGGSRPVAPEHPVVQISSKPNVPSSQITNSIGMKFVSIPAGEFEMGSPTGESWRQDDETLHHVKITKPYLMETTTVTQAQWKAIMGENPSHFLGDNRPVEMVSWDMATEFCEKLGAKEGNRYRLPTEAEWEYACRAGTKTPFGGTGNLEEMGWSNNISNNQTHDVATRKPNSFGLYDMAGNVRQWCSDGYGPYGGDAIDPKGADDGSKRVRRSGSWHSAPMDNRAAHRLGAAPDFRDNSTGFRVVLDRDGGKPNDSPAANGSPPKN